MPRERKKSGTRNIQTKLFIFCEGEKDKSESAYFKSFIHSCRFKGSKVDVRVIDSKKNTGKELVDAAIKEKKEFPDDVAWVVYDKDGYSKHGETFNRAKKKNINIAFSSISFEYWILLHYEYSTAQFLKSDDVIKYLKDKGYIDYSKSSQDIFLITQELLPDALKNAKSIQKYQKDVNPPDTPVYTLNPYSDIDTLIEAVQDLEVKQKNY